MDALKLISKVSIQELDSVDFMLLGLKVSTLVQFDHLSHQLVEDLTVFLKASLMVTAALLLLALVLRGNDLRYNVYLKKLNKYARKDLGLDIAGYKDYVNNLKEFASVNDDLGIFAIDNFNAD